MMMMKRPFAKGEPVGPLNIAPIEWGGGSAVWEYKVDPAHFNPAGALHGGVLMTLLDTAMGHAVAELVIPEGRFNVAAQMNINFMAPVREGVIRATATVRRLGKRLAVVEAEATDEEGRLVAIATATHTLLP
jgi:uncharacterized protein (TIGR00369 family)